MKKALEPVVGGTAAFYPQKFDTTRGPPPLMATITHVHDEKCVNLTATDGSGTEYENPNVTLIADGDPLPENGYYAILQDEGDDPADDADGKASKRKGKK